MIFLLLPVVENNIGASGILAVESGTDIQVNPSVRMLAIDVVDMSLKAVLKEIVQQAGIRLVFYGLEDIQISKNFTKVPLDKGIRRLVESRPVAILSKAPQASENRKNLQGIIAVWVFDPNAIGTALHLVEVISVNNPDMSLDLDLNTDVRYWSERLMRSTDRAERFESISALVRIETNEAITTIAMVFLGDNDIKLREHAVLRLATSEKFVAEQMIGMALLKDEDPMVRLLAVQMLIDRDTTAAYSYLNSALTDKDERVWSMAKDALEYRD